MPARVLKGRRVVLVDGVRTPFLRSGTAFNDLMAYELATMAVAGLLHKTRLDPALVDRLILGTVMSDPATTNVAREAALASGLPDSCPANTVTCACISANVAIQNAAEAIAAGAADIVIAGGTETLSDVPIRFRRPVRKRLIASQKARGAGDYLRLAAGLTPKDLLPEVPAIAEFSTGQTMGENAERLAKRLRIGREEQDAYALLSHRKAAKAAEAGFYRDQIVPASGPPSFQPLSKDNGVRGDSTMEKLASLPPAFDRRFGSVSAGNSSFLTDGASAVLLMSEEKARELSLEPLAAIHAFAFVALDPVEDLLLGPAYAVPQVLAACGLTLEDVGVLELHEAFAVPVLAVERLFVDEAFCRDRLGRGAVVGEIDADRLNAWGGSLSVGHPFGATGGRLAITCARRMVAEKAAWGVLSACAAGALGHATVLSR